MIDRVAMFLAKAAAEPVELSIGELLAVWGYSYRSPERAGRMGQDLSDAGLRCVPDFVQGDRDVMVRVGLPEAMGVEEHAGAAADGGEDVEQAEEDEPLRLPHVVPRIGDIPSAKAGVVSVLPSDSLPDAQGIMVDREFSQLAVMTGPYELVGAISWRTIATAKLAGQVTALVQAIDDSPVVVRTTDPLLNQIDTIYQADFVFVRAPDNRICGIVTTADLSARFRDLTTPFFELGEIELRLRRCVRKKGLTLEEIRQATGDKRIKSLEKMTFGNYCYLLKDEETWRKMGFEVPQEPFLTYLGQAHDIRNRVAHYDANPVSPEDGEHLKKCLGWMRHLDPGQLG
jgi:CBS domain-containing protein